jgi:hypothetical protein
VVKFKVHVQIRGQAVVEVEWSFIVSMACDVICEYGFGVEHSTFGEMANLFGVWLKVRHLGRRVVHATPSYFGGSLLPFREHGGDSFGLDEGFEDLLLVFSEGPHLVGLARKLKPYGGSAAWCLFVCQ